MSFAGDMRSELEAALEAHGDGPVPPDRMPEFRTFAADPEPRDMVAVDGSYNFLLNLSSWWLALISVGLLRYGFRQGRYHREDWRLVQRILGVSTWEPFVAQQDALHRALFEFTRGQADQHRQIVNEYRRFLEGQLAVNVADQEEGRIVAIDGALAAFPKEFDVMPRLVKVCKDRGHLLVGISKDSQLHAFGQAQTDEDFLRRCQSALDRQALAFVRAPPEAETAQKGLLYGDVYYVRFHPRAPKWFRVDLGTGRDDPEAALRQVAPYCRSLISIGYPLPLFEAHRMAVTVRQLRGVHQEAVLRTAVRMGMDIRQVLDGLTGIEGRKRGAFHEYLDRVTRGLR